MKKNWCGFKSLLALRPKNLLAILLVLCISLPVFTVQLLPSLASYHQTANVKNKRISYKEIRKRKHSKNNQGLKAQVITSGLILNLDPKNIDNMNAQASSTTSTTTWVDTSGYGNNGTLTNFMNLNPPTATSGWDLVSTATDTPTSALKFDGTDDYVSVANETAFEGFSTLTVEAFIKTSTIPTNNVVIVGKDDVDQQRSWGLMYLNFNRLYFFVYGTNNSYTDLLSGSFAPNDGKWHHVVVTWSSGTSMRMYIDGALATSTGAGNATGNLKDTTSPVTIGAATTNGGYFTGNIANVRVYNTALSASQVNQNYLAIAQQFQVVAPSTPVISSATINGTPQSTSATSFRITDGQTLRLGFSSMGYAGNQATIACNVPGNPPAGVFSSSPSSDSTANLAFTPTRSHVGMTYTYNIGATSYSGNGSSSTATLTISAIVTCTPGSSAGCADGQTCFESGTCAVPCPKNPSIPSGTLCTALPVPTASVSQPVTSSQSQSDPVQTPSATPTPVPIATATPVQNVTNSGNNSPPQGATVSPPSINTAPPISEATSTLQPSIGVIDISKNGIVKPTPTTTGIDLSVLKNNPPKVKPDSSPYIDLSKARFKKSP